MSLDGWGRVDSEAGRGKRVALSYAAASLLVAAVLGGGVVFGGEIKHRVLDDEVEVKFAPAAKPAPPPPPPPPPPAARAKAKSAGPPPPLGPKVDAPPTELPKKLVEADPANAKPAVAFGEGDPNGCVGCTGKPGGAAGAVVDAAPPEPPRPYQVAEVTTPPVAITRPVPAYPEEARKRAVDMVVVVKFIVTETGDVEDARIVRGHETLDAAVLDAIKGWKFTPGTLDGRPVKVVRLMKFPFHLRTAN